MLYFLLHELDCVHRLWGQYIDELIQLKALTTIGPQPLSAGNYYLLSDLLYRSAALTNSAGAVVEAFHTDAYGNTLLFSAGGGTCGAWFSNADSQAAYSACRYVFTGREYDVETQNYFYRARYYLAPLGTFVSRDPAGTGALGNTLTNPASGTGGSRWPNDPFTADYAALPYMFARTEFDPGTRDRELYGYGPSDYEFSDSNPTTASDPSGLGPVGMPGWGPINPLGHPKTSKAGTPCTYFRSAYIVAGYATPEACADALYPSTCRIPVGPVAYWVAGIASNALRASATAPTVAGGTVTASVGSVIAIAGTTVTAWNAGQWMRQWMDCLDRILMQGRWRWKQPGGWQCI